MTDTSTSRALYCTSKKSKLSFSLLVKLLLVTGKFRYVGQNLFVRGDYNNNARLDWRAVTGSWYSEVRKFIKIQADVSKFGSFKPTKPADQKDK